MDQREIELIGESCRRILASTTFSDSQRLRALTHGSAGDTGRLKEISIALEVFDRGPDFDPKTDPSVRVAAGRLRNKLAAYYSTEGASDPVQIEIPKGQYTPVFHFAPLSVLSPTASDAEGSTLPTATTVTSPGCRPLAKLYWRVAVGGCVVLLLITARFRSPVPSPILEDVRRVTAGDTLIESASLSRDGSLLAFAATGPGDPNIGLYLLNLDNRGSWPLKLTSSIQRPSLPSISPDGRSLLYCDQSSKAIFRTPLPDGPRQKWIEDGCRSRFSPDGQWILYQSANGSLMVASAATPTNSRRLGEGFARILSPIWAEDSHQILFYGWRDSATSDGDWFVCSKDGGQPVATEAMPALLKHVIDRKRTVLILPVAWFRDRVYFSARVGERSNIWSIPLSPRDKKVGGIPTQLTFGSGLEIVVDISSRGRLTFMSSQQRFNLHAVPITQANPEGPNPLKPLTANSVYNFGPSVSADSRKLAFISNRSGDWEIWTKRLDRDEPEQLVMRSEHKLLPRLSPDGSQIAIGQFEIMSRTHGIFVVPFEGGTPRKVCDNCGDPVGWDPTSGKIILHSGRPGTSTSDYVRLLDVQTGQIAELIRLDNRRIEPVNVSPDGRFLLVSASSAGAESRHHLVPLHSGKAAPESEWIRVGQTIDSSAWAPDGRTLYFLSDADGYECIYRLELDQRAGSPSGVWPLRHFHDRSRMPWNNVLALAATSHSLLVTLRDHSTELWMGSLQ